MKSITQTRRERLLLAIDEKCDGSRTKFADLMGWKSPARVQRYITEKDSNKNIGHKLAREIEAALGLPANWMDVPAIAGRPLDLTATGGFNMTVVPGTLAQQLVAIFNALSPDGQDLLLIRANRLYTEEHPDETSTASPFGRVSLKVANPHHHAAKKN